jgi:hypothetical protein
MDLVLVEHNNRIKTNPNTVAAIRSHFKAIKNQTKTLEKVIITDINQVNIKFLLSFKTLKREKSF